MDGKQVCAGTIVIVIIIVCAYIAFTMIFPPTYDATFHGVNIHSDSSGSHELDNPTNELLVFEDSETELIYSYDYYTNVEQAKNFSEVSDGVVYQANDSGYVVGFVSEDGGGTYYDSVSAIKKVTTGNIVN